MVTAFIALGSNLASPLGDPAQNLVGARLAIAAMPQTKLVAASSTYRTVPDNAEGGDFANAVVKIETELSAYGLLAQLQRIEIEFGRPAPNTPSRSGKALQDINGLKPSRTLDLDILLYGDAMIQSPSLTVPHPRMHERAFVMLPLKELT